MRSAPPPKRPSGSQADTSARGDARHSKPPGATAAHRVRDQELEGPAQAGARGEGTLAVGAVAALEDALDEHQLVPAAELDRLVADERERQHGGIGHGHHRSVERDACAEAVAGGGEAHRP